MSPELAAVVEIIVRVGDLESENKQLRELNAELLAALKDLTDWAAASEAWPESFHQSALAAIAKAEKLK